MGDIMKRQTSIFLKTVGITSVICFIVLGAIYISISSPKPKNNSSLIAKKEFEPSESDKFTILVSLSQSSDRVPYSYFLIGFNGEKNTVSVSRLFGNTILSEKKESSVIASEVYSRGGVDGVLECINRFFGLDIKSYIEFTDSTVVPFFDMHKNIVLDCPQKINEADSDRDVYIALDSGRQAFSGVMLKDYLCVTTFEGGDNEALYESSRAVCEFIRQNHRAFSLKEGNSVSYILEKCRHNLSVYDIEKRRELIEFLLYSSGESVCFYACTGESEKMNTAFRLDLKSKETVRERYS